MTVPRVRHDRLTVLASFLLVAVLVAACNSANPTPSPEPSPTAAPSSAAASSPPSEAPSAAPSSEPDGGRPDLRRDRAGGRRAPWPAADRRRGAHDARRGAARRGDGEALPGGVAARAGRRERALLQGPRPAPAGREPRGPHGRDAERRGRGVLPRRPEDAVRRVTLRRGRREREDHVRPRVQPRAPGPALHDLQGPGGRHQPERLAARPSGRLRGRFLAADDAVGVGELHARGVPRSCWRRASTIRPRRCSSGCRRSCARRCSIRTRRA